MPPTGRPGLKRGGTEKFGIEELPGYSQKQASKPLNLFSAGATKRESSDYVIGGGRTSAQKQMSSKKMIGGTQSTGHENKKVNMAGITSSSKKIRNMKPPCPAAMISH